MMCSYTNKADFPTTPLQDIGSRRLNPFAKFLPKSHCSMLELGKWLFTFGKGPTASAARAAVYGWTVLP